MSEEDKNVTEERVSTNVKYCTDLEGDLIKWMSGVLEEPDLFAGVSGMDDFQAKLKDGLILIRLMNRLLPEEQSIIT